jgi:serine/threonine protein kinase
MDAALTSAPLASPPAPAAQRLIFCKDEILDDNYRIIDGIAAGGMGEIYRAVHLRLPRTLAIKTLQPEFASQNEWVARFCREACVLAQLRHPNIVQVLDFNVARNGIPYIAMELIEGNDLRAELDRGRRFEPVEIASIVRQVASALDAAHAAGVVHRDLKPENVLLTPAAGQFPVVKVIDFGLSMCGWSERVTGDCRVFGTPDYMAPEQAQGLRDQTDARTDQFALAALTYTLLSGRAPFARETPVAVLYAVVHEEPAALAAASGWDASPVERVLRRGMSRERDDRYPSVLAFAEALEAAFIEGGALPRPTTPAPLGLASAPSASGDAQGASRRHSRQSHHSRHMADDERPARTLGAVAIRRGVPALLAALVVSAALWSGVATMRGVPPAARPAGWRGNAGAALQTVSTSWNELKGFFAADPEATSPHP